MRQPKRVAAAIVTAILLSLAVFAVGVQKDDKEAADTLIKAARFLEEKPLDKKAKDVRAWAVKWTIETDKVTVKICSLLLSGVDKKYKYNSELLSQYTIAMTAFKLSHPDQAGDEDAAQDAGIQSALLSYEAIMKEQPKAKNAFLDDLVTKRSQGGLSKFIKENNCKGEK